MHWHGGYDEHDEWDGTTDGSDIAHISMGGDTYWCRMTERLDAQIDDHGTCTLCGCPNRYAR